MLKCIFFVLDSLCRIAPSRPYPRNGLLIGFAPVLSGELLLFRCRR